MVVIYSFSFFSSINRHLFGNGGGRKLVCMCECECVCAETFLCDGLNLELCFWGAVDTEGKSPSCWNFNISFTSVFIPFWNTMNPSGKKFAKVCAVRWAILIKVKGWCGKRQGGTLTPYLHLPGSSNALSYMWRSMSEGHPLEKTSGGSTLWRGHDSKNRLWVHPEGRVHIFLKEEVVTPENSWVHFTTSMLDLLLVAGQHISIYISQETLYSYEQLLLFFYLPGYRLERNVVLNTNLKITNFHSKISYLKMSLVKYHFFSETFSVHLIYNIPSGNIS